MKNAMSECFRTCWFPRAMGTVRLSVIGPLLAAPPERGDLPEQVQSLADRKWRHPITGQWVQFGLSTIERWFDTARNEKKLESIRNPSKKDGPENCFRRQSAIFLSTLIISRSFK